MGWDTFLKKKKTRDIIVLFHINYWWWGRGLQLYQNGDDRYAGTLLFVKIEIYLAAEIIILTILF